MEDRPHDPWTPEGSPTSSTPPPFPPQSPPPPPSEPPPPPVTARPPIPWEEPGRPWPDAFFATVKLLFSRPREAFERMPITGDVLKPFVFALITGWIGVLFQSLWELSMRDTMRAMAPPGAWKGMYDVPVGAWPFFAALGPFLVAIGLLLNTVVYQLFLFLTGSAKRGIAATLRVLCYAQAASLLAIVPFCGSLVGGIWMLVLAIIGLSAAHGISTGRAALAVLLPIALCCTCIALAFLLFGTALWSMFGRAEMP